MNQDDRETILKKIATLAAQIEKASAAESERLATDLQEKIRQLEQLS